MTATTPDDLDLLALLSPTPAPVRCLMEDLGLDMQRDLYGALKRLQKAGYAVRTELIEGTNQRGACIDREGWPAAYRAALDHVDGDRRI